MSESDPAPAAIKAIDAIDTSEGSAIEGDTTGGKTIGGNVTGGGPIVKV